jgi:hypothetical protein
MKWLAALLLCQVVETAEPPRVIDLPDKTKLSLTVNVQVPKEVLDAVESIRDDVARVPGIVQSQGAALVERAAWFALVGFAAGFVTNSALRSAFGR